MVTLKKPFADGTRVIETQTFAEHLARAKKLTTKYNGGIDWFFPDKPVGTDILAAREARVTRIVVLDPGYGNVVYTIDADGYTTIYGHLDTISVKLNQWVYVGDKIGTSGWTGNVFDVNGNKTPDAAHLHFEERDQNGAPVDPELFFIKPKEETRKATVAAGDKLTVTATGGLALRSGPGTENPVYAWMPVGSVVTAADLPQTTDSAGITWQPVVAWAAVNWLVKKT